MSEATIHFGGLPTAPQVRKLEEAYPDLEALRGTNILHADIERLIGEKRGEGRYKTVTNSWRKRAEDKNFVIDGEGEAVGVGFRVLTHAEQAEHSRKRRKRGIRQIRRGFTEAVGVNTAKLSDEQRRLHEKDMLAFGRLNAAVLESRRPQIVAPQPVEKSA